MAHSLQMVQSAPPGMTDSGPGRLGTERIDVRPGLVRAIVVMALYGGFAASVDFARAARGFYTDEATYYLMGHSVASDGDLAYRREDLARVWREFPSGPLGVCLKRGRDVEARMAAGWPPLAVESRPDPDQTRLYYGKSFVYPLLAAPFVRMMGTNGFLMFNAVLMALVTLAAYVFVAARDATCRGADLLETFANQTAVAVERGLLAEEAHTAQVRVETEKLRSSLLTSVSHDLRTPLAAITGAASSLLQTEPSLDPATRRELIETVRDEADRLGRLVQNLLDMTRLESGAVITQKEWHALEDALGPALQRLGHALRERQVAIRIPEDLPLVPMDDVLVEQVLINLLDNAAKYTPGMTPIEISAVIRDGAVEVAVADRGSGLGPEDVARVFDKFYRGGKPSGRGAGLGLPI